MTATLALYSAASWALEPLAGRLLRSRVSKGKERADRASERLGRTGLGRPPGPLLWMHAASVGESRLLLDIAAALREQREDLVTLLTTQTLTSADMIASRKQPGVIHQMAPIDGPRTVGRFLGHWRPDAAVFAEGEIWPNLLRGLKHRRVPAALVNARMTARSLMTWRRWPGAARELFGAFNFIGAADQTTAQGLSAVIGRKIEVIGNLKRASPIEQPDRAAVARWRSSVGTRPILLAASTHPGEDELALDAFAEVRAREPGALLIIAPRHPVRGPDIAAAASSRGLSALLRSADPATPGVGVDVLVADTMGEMMFWYAVSDAVYLGGANAADVGGHNPIEPAQLGKRVFTGPHGFNFREVFDELAAANAVTIGVTSDELSRYWLAELAGGASADPAALSAFLAEGQAPFAATVKAVLALLPVPVREAARA